MARAVHIKVPDYNVNIRVFYCVKSRRIMYLILSMGTINEQKQREAQISFLIFGKLTAMSLHLISYWYPVASSWFACVYLTLRPSS